MIFLITISEGSSMGIGAKSIGFIGGGALTEALLKGIAGKLVPDPSMIFVSDHKGDRCEELHNRYGVTAAVGAEGFISEADAVILAIKPKDGEMAMEEIEGSLKRDAIVISVVAGLSLEAIERHFPAQPVFRVMPNVPQAIGEGMAAYSPGKNADADTCSMVEELWSSVGKIVHVEEKLMDAVTGLSGSGPAYGFLMIDALADGGVAAGLPRKTAILLSAQTLLGAAKMVIETGAHPDVLRDQVTSPAGTTIAGIRALEGAGMRSALIEAVLAATERSKELGKL